MKINIKIEFSYYDDIDDWASEFVFGDEEALDFFAFRCHNDTIQSSWDELKVSLKMEIPKHARLLFNYLNEQNTLLNKYDEITTCLDE
jgi:hypothetical protein